MRNITGKDWAKAAAALTALAGIHVYEHHDEKKKLWEAFNTAPIAGEKPCTVRLGDDAKSVFLTDNHDGKKVEVKYEVNNGQYKLVSSYFHPELSENWMVERRAQLSTDAIIKKVNDATCKVAGRENVPVRSIKEEIVAKRFYYNNCRPR